MRIIDLRTLQLAADIPIIEGDKLKFTNLLKTLWLGSRLIGAVIFLALLVGLLVALFSPVKYRAAVVVMPREAEQASGLGALGSFAGLAGINLSGAFLAGSAEISPILYSDIVNSTPFVLELVSKNYHL